MNTNIPEGVDMRRADPTFQPYEAYLPTVPDPLDVESPKTENEAAERVCTYLYQAKGDPGTSDLQWYTAQVQIYPWSIQQDAFDRLTDSLDDGFPYFDHELAYDVWLSDVAFTLDKKEGFK